MNILQAKEAIKNTITAYLQKDEDGLYRIPVMAQRPILLIGPPGIGKTAIMEQIAQECQVGLVAYTMTHHTRQSAIGLPMIEKRSYGGKEYSATEYTMSEIIGTVYDTMARTKKTEGILFLDEINCVSETLAPTMLQFLQKKMFGNHAVPNGWIIVAAGNPPEYNKSVKEFDIVTLDRVRKMEIQEDFPVWKGYAYGRGVHPSIITYLEIKKENFYQVETVAGGKRFVTARGWEDLSYMIYAQERLELPVDETLIAQYVQHPKIAKDFANYYDLYNQYKNDYHVDEIFDGTIRPEAITKIQEARFDEKLSLIGLLIGRLNESFRQQQMQQALVSGLYEVLVRVKEAGITRGEALVSMLEKHMENTDEKEAQLLRALDGYHSRAVLGGTFEDLKQMFEASVEVLSQKTDEGARLLEAAFDFLEKAFGESQEMVMFITELNTSGPAVAFIRENGCERYYKYNQGLLFSSGYDAMLQELDTIAPYMDFLGI